MAEETFGFRLKQLREQAGLTQLQLAELAGLNQFSVAKLEQDQYSPTWPTVQSLAKALNVNCLAFEGTVEPPKPGDKPPGKRGRPRKQPPAVESEAPPPPEVPPEEKPRGKRKKGGKE